MSNRAFGWMLFWIFLFIFALWVYWPRNVPCERLVSVGGEMVGTPMGCFVDLKAKEGK